MKENNKLLLVWRRKGNQFSSYKKSWTESDDKMDWWITMGLEDITNVKNSRWNMEKFLPSSHYHTMEYSNLPMWFPVHNVFLIPLNFLCDR